MVATPALRDLNKLNAFVRVAEHRSFTKAARDLGTFPSVISRRMSELEGSLGFSLMNRSTHGVILTEAGEGLLKNCLHMLAMIDDYVVDTRNLQTGPYGSLRVKAPSGYARWILAPAVARFVREHPKVRVQLIAEAPALAAGDDGCDIIIASRQPSEPGLVGREIGTVRYVVCASPKYLRLRGTPADPVELQQHNCLVNSAFSAKEWPFKIGSKSVLVSVKGSCSSNSSDVLVQYALDDVGIIRVPHYAIEAELKRGKLKAILGDATHSRETVRAYFSKTKHLPAKVTNFVQFLQKALAADAV
jgi:DNA-binding transcriptional LysR family regulator